MVISQILSFPVACIINYANDQQMEGEVLTSGTKKRQIHPMQMHATYQEAFTHGTIMNELSLNILSKRILLD